MAGIPHIRTALRMMAGLAMVLSAGAAAQTITYHYDLNGRLTSVDYGGGHVVTYVYDPASNTVQELSAAPENTLFVSVSPAGSGSVAGNGIACPGDCSEAFTASTSVSLTAAPLSGWILLGWTGDAIGAANPLSLDMGTDRSVGCFFGASSGHTDLDGLADTTEMGPAGTDPSYDGNHDGVPDYQQSNVGSLATFDGRAYVTLAVASPMTLSAIAAVPNPSPADAPPGVAFPFGFFSFTIEGLEAGGCARLDMFFPPSNLESYYKHGPTPDDGTSHWYEFVHYHPQIPGAEIHLGDGFVQVQLYLCDAQLGDDDVTATDARITDVGGPSGTLGTQITADPTSLDFGDQPVGSSAEATLTVSSSGGGEVLIGQIGEADPLNDPFALVDDGCSGAALAPGESCTITVRFAPIEAGGFSDTFDIPSNDASNPSLRVSVTGSGSRAPGIPAASLPGLTLLVLVMTLASFGILRRGSV